MSATTIAALHLPAFGTPFEGGFYGGIVRSNDALHAIAWAPKTQGETDSILLDSGNTPLVAMSCHDSMANTRALAELGSPAAIWALGLQINGFSDWCVAARDVLELGYRHLKPSTQKNWATFRDGENPSCVPPAYCYTKDEPRQTLVEAFQAGGSEAFDKPWYHTSTQYGASSAWFQVFSDGNQNDDDLSAEGGVRAVRLILLSA